MYEANGLNLSRSEYVALKQFIKMSKHEEVSAWIVYGDDAPTARLLAAKGLITGQQIGDAYRVDRATKLGHDFLRDFKSERRKDRFRTYFPPVIGGVLGIAGTVVGVILGWHLGRL